VQGDCSWTRVALLASMIDAIYQIIASQGFYPGEALLLVFPHAFVPYLLIRGRVNRIACRLPGFTPVSRTETSARI
jgi:hypothetical protein